MIDGCHIALFRDRLTPFSFDFLWQLLNLKLYCRVHNIGRIAARFDPLPPDFKPVLGRGEASNLDTIMRPLMRMLDIGEHLGPDGIDLAAPPENMSTWCEAWRRNKWLPPKLKPNKESVGYDDAVTITLRESSYQTDRNSDIAEWLKVAEWLKEAGHRVVFVRDTAKSDEEIDGFEIHADAARDLDTRVALYQTARMNLFTANGPATICTSTNDVPYLMMTPPATVAMFERLHHNFAVAHIGDMKPSGYRETDQWRAWLGFGKGEQVPWADTRRQRWAWADDTFESIRGVLEQMVI